MVPPPSSPLTANSVFSPAQMFFCFLFLVLPVSSFSISLSIFSIFFLILLDFSSSLGCYIVSPWAMLLLDSEKSIPHFMVHDVVVTPSLKEVTGHYFTSRMMQKAWKCFFFFFLLSNVGWCGVASVQGHHHWITAGIEQCWSPPSCCPWWTAALRLSIKL